MSKRRSSIPTDKGKWVKEKQDPNSPVHLQDKIIPLYENFNPWEWNSLDEKSQKKWDLDMATGHYERGGKIWMRKPDKRVRITDNVYEDWYYIEGDEHYWYPEAKNDTTYGWWEGLNEKERKEVFFKKHREEYGIEYHNKRYNPEYLEHIGVSPSAENKAWEEMERKNRNAADDTFKEN